MFVLESTHRRLKLQHEFEMECAQVKYAALVAQWNSLVRRVNARGVIESSNPFDKKDIRKLLSLCHPDKHGGSEVAEEMTRKILKLR